MLEYFIGFSKEESLTHLSAVEAIIVIFLSFVIVVKYLIGLKKFLKLSISSSLLSGFLSECHLPDRFRNAYLIPSLLQYSSISRIS
jgi:hypothetical protein